jgi:hypothetical protein
MNINVLLKRMESHPEDEAIIYDNRIFRYTDISTLTTRWTENLKKKTWFLERLSR